MKQAISTLDAFNRDVNQKCYPINCVIMLLCGLSLYIINILNCEFNKIFFFFKKYFMLTKALLLLSNNLALCPLDTVSHL